MSEVVRISELTAGEPSDFSDEVIVPVTQSEQTRRLTGRELIGLRVVKDIWLNLTNDLGWGLGEEVVWTPTRSGWASVDGPIYNDDEQFAVAYIMKGAVHDWDNQMGTAFWAQKENAVPYHVNRSMGQERWYERYWFEAGQPYLFSFEYEYWGSGTDPESVDITGLVASIQHLGGISSAFGVDEGSIVYAEGAEKTDPLILTLTDEGPRYIPPWEILNLDGGENSALQRGVVLAGNRNIVHGRQSVVMGDVNRVKGDRSLTVGLGARNKTNNSLVVSSRDSSGGITAQRRQFADIWRIQSHLIGSKNFLVNLYEGLVFAKGTVTFHRNVVDHYKVWDFSFKAIIDDVGAVTYIEGPTTDVIYENEVSETDSIALNFDTSGSEPIALKIDMGSYNTSWAGMRITFFVTLDEEIHADDTEEDFDYS